MRIPCNISIVLAGAILILSATLAKSALGSPVAQTGDRGIGMNDPYQSELFRVRGVPSITIHTLAGEIEVIRNPELQGVQVDLYVDHSFSFWSRSRSLDDYRIIFQQSGNQIVASVEDIRSGKRVHYPGSTNFTFIVQIPGDEASLNLRSINGDISVKGFSGNHYIQNHAGNLYLENVEGEVRAASTAGNIELLDSEGVLFANSISGSIYVEGAKGEIRLRSISGNVESRNISGTLVAASTSGNIYSDFRNVTQGIHLETVSGDLELIIPGRLGYSVDARGSEFDFQNLDLTIHNRDFRTEHTSFVLRDGTIPIHVSTVSGRIKIRER